jgi:hypothetical protein
MIKPVNSAAVNESMEDANGMTNVEPTPAAEDNKPEFNYSDPKYLQVLKVLDELGFPGSKFLGAQGYYVPSDDQYVRLVCTNPDDGFKLNICGGIYSIGPAAEMIGKLNAYTPMLDRLNFVLSGATDADTKDRHINESIIQMGDADFGKAGSYILYRNGVDQTQRGLISFADHFQGAECYKNPENPLPTKKYLVTLSNPFAVSAQNSYEAMKSAYQSLTGKEISIDPEQTKVNDAWRDIDKEMAGALADQGYDALIYKVPSCNEVLVVGTDLTKVPSISEYTESTRNIVDQKSREHE